MTDISDEMLMAYADGQLDALDAKRVEQAVENDASVAARVTAYRRTSARISAAYAPILDEPAPDRLSALLQSSSVVTLADERTRRWGLREFGAMAASLAAGLVIVLALPSANPVLRETSSGVIAGGALDRALTRDVASTMVGLTFKTKEGGYCRTFSLNASAGIACREEGAWAVRALTRSQTVATPYQTASSALPPEILAIVETNIEGEALDAEAVKAARENGWR